MTNIQICDKYDLTNLNLSFAFGDKYPKFVTNMKSADTLL
jgi:hypothetical protein